MVYLLRPSIAPLNHIAPLNPRATLVAFVFIFKAVHYDIVTLRWQSRFVCMCARQFLNPSKSDILPFSSKWILQPHLSRMIPVSRLLRLLSRMIPVSRLLRLLSLILHILNYQIFSNFSPKK